ncbi:hypothetical protein [Flavobacterium sp.]|uniref:hypothetical protein n=1 Tax=Flavobacterium sp. TaxID=239 RepID=UPI0035293448
MKKLLPLFLLLFLATSATSPLEKEVYICGSNGAKRYHFTKNCRGLNNCQHKLYKKSLSSAKSLGLTLCKWED